MAAPPGTRLTTNPTRGRCLLANRPFQPGELIATFTQPLLALPDGPGMRTTCNYCLRVEQPGAERSLRACTGCRAVVYCDANCQRAHWKVVHKVECKMFSRVREKVGKDWLPTPTRAVAQVLLLLKAGDPAMLAAFGDECSLEGNVEGFRGVEEVWADFELQAMAAVVYGGLLESEEMLTKAKEVLCKVSSMRCVTPGRVLEADGRGIDTNQCLQPARCRQWRSWHLPRRWALHDQPLLCTQRLYWLRQEDGYAEG